MNIDVKTRGRPKDDQLNQRVMRAAWSLLGRKSLSELTISEIAAAAHTSRPAIYRRWSTVEELLIDAFLDTVKDEVPAPATDDPVEGLREYIGSLVKFISGRVGRTIAEILGRAQSDPKLMKTYHDRFQNERRDHGRELVLRGQAMGVFRREIDSDIVIDLYAGPIYFRAFTHHAPLDDHFARALADRVLAAIVTNPS